MTRHLWIFSLAALGGITAMSIDIYLPSMPAIATEFGTNMTELQWTLSGFVIAFALGQLAYGPISDRFGRRKPLMIGLGLYALGTWLCATAGSFEMLVIARLLQGLGASSGAVSCLAMARDQFDGAEMVQVLALVGAVVGLAPIVAPLIGGILESLFHWRASFVFLMVFASLLWLWVCFKLPETRSQQGQPLSASLSQYKLLLKHSEFVVFASLTTFSFLSIFAFLTIGGPILMGNMGLSSGTFSVMFASNASMFLFSNLLTAKLSRRKSSQELVTLGILIMAFSGLSMLGLAWTQNPWALVVPMHGVTFGAAIVMIMGNAGSVAPFQEIAGSASALAGTLRFVAAGLLAGALSSIESATALHLSMVILLCMLICVAAAVRLYACKDREIAPEAPPAA